MRVGMIANLYHDPATAHFVGDCACGAGPGEGVEHEIAFIGR
jgi:hypothetical protein